MLELLIIVILFCAFPDICISLAILGTLILAGAIIANNLPEHTSTLSNSDFISTVCGLAFAALISLGSYFLVKFFCKLWN